MKLIIATLVCLLLAGMWLQDVDAKSSEFSWSHLGEGGDSDGHSGVAGWGNRFTLSSLPPSPLLREEFSPKRRKGGLGWGQGASKRNVNLESTLTTEQLASVKGGLLRLDSAA